MGLNPNGEELGCDPSVSEFDSHRSLLNDKIKPGDKMIEIPHKKAIIVHESDLNDILTEEYDARFNLQQWAFLPGEPVGQDTIHDSYIGKDLHEESNGVEVFNDVDYTKPLEPQFIELIETWKEKSKTNKNIALRPDWDDIVDAKILLWNMCRQGKLKSLGHVKIHVWW